MINLSAKLRERPLRIRLALVAVYLCLRAFHHGSFFAHAYDWRDLMEDGTIVLALLNSPKGRPFWLFIGLFVGQIIGLIMAASVTGH